MRIRFTQDVIFETQGRKLGPRFEAGSVHDLRGDLAQRWIRREVAIPADDPAAAPVSVAATSDTAAVTGTPGRRGKPGTSEPVSARSAADDAIIVDRADPGQQPGPDDARDRKG
jgi:hypothetical protein